ncbi:MAG: adenylyl-sulfate kinase [Nocardioides sp.]
MTRSHVILIGGRSGVGKSSVAAELHHQLIALDVRHAWIEGDNLDMAHPMPWRAGHRVAEHSLAAMWANYRALGYARLIYTNTASVHPEQVASLTRALGDDPVVTAALLTATDETADARLCRREIGSEFAASSERSRVAARELELEAGSDVVRVPTDQRTVEDIALQIIELAGWQLSAS